MTRQRPVCGLLELLELIVHLLEMYEEIIVHVYRSPERLPTGTGTARKTGQISRM